MKYTRSLVLIVTLLSLFLIMASCSTETNIMESNEYTSTEATQDEGSDRTQDGTPVILEMNGVAVKAVLNNTLTAREIIKLLPYSVTVSRAADDLCGSVSEDLPADPGEGQQSWKLGEIGWFGGWFTILVDHEEKFSNMPGVMIIGKIDDNDLPTVSAFSGRVDITVKLDD